MWYPKFELNLIWVWKTETFKPSFVFLAFKIVEIRGDRDATIDDPVQEYIYFVVSVTLYFLKIFNGRRVYKFLATHPFE